jgi:ribose transport system permease protein
VTATDSAQDSAPVIRARRAPRWYSFSKISAVYVLIVLFVVFSIWIPDRFYQIGVWRSLLDAESLTALAAISALIPLVTGALNLAIGGQVGFAAILSAVLLAKTGMPIWVQFPLVVIIGAVIGWIVGLLITKIRIDSIIATLGASSLLLAGMAWVSGSHQVLFATEHPGYTKIGTTQLFGITVPVYVLVLIALIGWFVMERTPLGRRMYAAGFNPESARLAGVRVGRLQVGALVAGGALAALAGALLTARLNAGDPTVGPSFLLPALTAVFLGSTQFRGGRFNVWGTVLSVYVLAVGIKGLQLAGMPRFTEDLFFGISLLFAVGLARLERRGTRGDAIRRTLRFRRKATA